MFLLAQTTQPSPLDPSTLSSVAGIIVATTFIMQYVKGMVGNVSYLKKVPTFVYVLTVALILTVIANKVLGTLSGNLGQLLYSTGSAALAASGFYQWVKDGMSGIETTHSEYKQNQPVAPTPPQPEDESVQHMQITPDDLKW